LVNVAPRSIQRMAALAVLRVRRAPPRGGFGLL